MWARVDLNGGYDGSFVDGNAMLFNVSAVPIPEPATVAIASLGIIGLLILGRGDGA